MQPPTLDGILSIRGVVELEDAGTDEEARAAIDAEMLAALDAALDDLVAMRAREGTAIGAVLGERLDEIARLTEAAEASPARRPEAIRARLAEQIAALLDAGTTDLEVVSNNAGVDDWGLGLLLSARRLRRVVASYVGENKEFARQYLAGELEVELTPQGTLAERMRAAGAGIGAFFSPTGVGTPLAEGRETRVIDGRTYVLEFPIKGDVALIGAHRADRMGNLVYRKTARNFGPVMATAAALVICQVREVVPAGGLDPEAVVTPGIYVDRVVAV